MTAFAILEHHPCFMTFFPDIFMAQASADMVIKAETSAPLALLLPRKKTKMTRYLKENHIGQTSGLSSPCIFMALVLSERVINLRHRLLHIQPYLLLQVEPQPYLLLRAEPQHDINILAQGANLDFKVVIFFFFMIMEFLGGLA